jgi:hypothetical protein
MCCCCCGVAAQVAVDCHRTAHLYTSRHCVVVLGNVMIRGVLSGAQHHNVTFLVDIRTTPKHDWVWAVVLWGTCWRCEAGAAEPSKQLCSGTLPVDGLLCCSVSKLARVSQFQGLSRGRVWMRLLHCLLHQAGSRVWLQHTPCVASVDVASSRLAFDACITVSAHNTASRHRWRATPLCMSSARVVETRQLWPSHACV